MGCTEPDFRRPGTHLRDAGHLIYRAADRRTGELRYRAVPDGTVTRLAEAPAGIAIELLAAIPSIVYGMWGLFIFAPLFATYFQEPVGNVLSTIPFVGALFAGPAFGIGILAAGVILAIMIIPYIAAVMRDVFEQTPVMMKESAYGIGCTTWEVIWRIVLPFTKNGVIGG